jgi:hypothetical protein
VDLTRRRSPSGESGDSRDYSISPEGCIRESRVFAPFSLEENGIRRKTAFVDMSNATASGEML